MTQSNWSERPADFQFLADSGLLFEINRTVLHQFGLALVLERNPATGELRLARQLQDCRDDPSKLVYDAGTFELGREKLARFRSELGDRLMDRRIAALGWACQHYPRRP